jgi:glycosyltransferase involved in cell wall biosynthesis
VTGRPRPLRVTLFSDAEYFGGAEGYLSLLAAHLDRERFALDLVLPSTPGAEILAERMRALDVAVHRFDRMGLEWPRRLGAAVRLLRGVGGDVLHLNLPSVYDGGVCSAAWAARRAGYRRVVSTEHLPMVARKYRQFPVKLFFTQWIDTIIVNTRSHREFLLRRHGIDPDRIAVVDNGVEDAPALGAAEREAARREWGAGPETAVVGIVGRLTRRKGHHFLLEALAGLQANGSAPPWKLVVVGEGEDESRLHALGEPLRRAGRVCWLGHREDAPRLMRAFDLLVLPSTLETMPFAILEGMAASLPVLASAIYGIPELIVHGETGYLLRPGDVGELGARVEELLRDPARRCALGEAGRRRYAERFTAERMAGRTAAIYQGAVERS